MDGMEKHAQNLASYPGYGNGEYPYPMEPLQQQAPGPSSMNVPPSNRSPEKKPCIWPKAKGRLRHGHHHRNHPASFHHHHRLAPRTTSTTE
ncbi:hypothetical protein ACOMHN_039596 [Nucella lapillus]